MNRARARRDLELVASLVEPGVRVLDVGCGDGTLLDMLTRTRAVDARGLELSREGVAACVARGFSVVQGDADSDLADYPDNAFDYVILTQTIQAMRRPHEMLSEALRIGRRAILSVPNFGQWRLRLTLLATGRMPQSAAPAAEWFETQNIRLCTIRDFVRLCEARRAHIEKAYAGVRDRSPRPFTPRGVSLAAMNFLAEEAIFLLRRSV